MKSGILCSIDPKGNDPKDVLPPFGVNVLVLATGFYDAAHNDGFVVAKLEEDDNSNPSWYYGKQGYEIDTVLKWWDLPIH